MKIKAQASFWLNEQSRGTIKGAVACNPSAAVKFFGPLPVIRSDGNELALIAGAAWRSQATDAELDQSSEDESLFASQSFDEKRASAAATYAAGQRGECYSKFRGDGQIKQSTRPPTPASHQEKEEIFKELPTFSK